MRQKVLVVAAHPDDEVLGCGGTIARLSQEGCKVFTLILGEGVTARSNNRNNEKAKKATDNLAKDARKANKILGSQKVYFGGFPDNRFDTVPLLEIIKCIEQVKNELRPSIIFTHSENDLNIDHRITYRAVITATRPLTGEGVREIYAFEVMSSTEWQYPASFSPDIFFDISNTINLKIKALSRYKSELKEFPHPRSLEGIELNAKYRGMNVGVSYAEAFKCVRVIR